MGSIAGRGLGDLSSKSIAAQHCESLARGGGWQKSVQQKTPGCTDIFGLANANQLAAS